MGLGARAAPAGGPGAGLIVRTPHQGTRWGPQPKALEAMGLPPQKHPCPLAEESVAGPLRKGQCQHERISSSVHCERQLSEHLLSVFLRREM